MAYNITRSETGLSNIESIITIQDGALNIVDTSLALVGKNRTDFGEILNQNLLYLLENFANATMPNNPTKGQLWYDTTTDDNELKIYDGTNFVPISTSSIISSTTEPSDPEDGQLWYDTDKNLLNIYDGTKFVPVNFPIISDGPELVSDNVEGQFWYDTSDDQKILKILINDEWVSAGGSGQGDLKIAFRKRKDNTTATGVEHDTIETIANGEIVSIINADTTAWTPRSNEFLEDGITLLSTQFSTIQAGINLNSTGEYKFRGTAVTAQYADLGERYASDKIYEPGTVVKLGGSHEITETTREIDSDVFGVISKNPGFELNSNAGSDDTHPYVALAGRIYCKIIGPIKKGDRLVSSHDNGIARKATMFEPGDYRVVIGRALQDKNTNEIGLIEIVVGSK